MSKEGTQDWTDLAVGLYDKLTGRNAQITYDFENMEIQVPGGVEENPSHAKWVLNGKVNIRTTDTKNK